MESKILLLLMTLVSSQFITANKLKIQDISPESSNTGLNNYGPNIQLLTAKQNGEKYNQAANMNNEVIALSPESALQLFSMNSASPGIQMDKTDETIPDIKEPTLQTNESKTNSISDDGPQSELSAQGKELLIVEELDASQSVRQERGLYGDDYGYDGYSDIGDHGGYNGYGGYKGLGSYGSKGQGGYNYGGEHGNQQGYTKGYSKGYEHKYSHAYGNDYGQKHKKGHGYGQQQYGYGNGGYGHGGYGHGLYGHGGYHGYGHSLLGGLGGLYGRRFLGGLRGGFHLGLGGLGGYGIGGLRGYGGYGIGGLRGYGGYGIRGGIGGYGGLRGYGFNPWYGYY